MDPGTPTVKEQRAPLKGHRSQRLLGRRLLILAALIPLAGLFALLVWAMAHSGGPSGRGINATLGEVRIQQRPAKDFSLALFDGRTLGLLELRGKVVVVDFWASWCPPCRQEAPVLARVYQEYRGKGVEFVGVAIWDAEEDAREYVRRYGIAFPAGLDKRGAMAIDYGVTGIPEKYFINRNGVLVKKFIGPMDQQKLRKVLDDLLAQ